MTTVSNHHNAADGRLFLGTAGWSYPDWRGFFYPAKPGRGFSELGWLARYVTAAEINTSFYRIPDPAHVQRWVQTVSRRKRFVFTMKLWREFTHTNDPINDADAVAFESAIEPLARSGRLAGLLAQFPWSFKYGQAGLDRIKELADRFARWGLIVEVRHDSWLRDDFYEFLQDRGCAFCNIDQPVIGQSAPPSSVVTAAPAYVRFHGRRYDAWFAQDSDGARRYDYLYKTEELEEWAERIREMLPKAERTLVIANNHFNAKAVAATLEMRRLLTDQRPPAPAELLNAYPHLRSICALDAETSDAGVQQQLF